MPSSHTSAACINYKLGVLIAENPVAEICFPLPKLMVWSGFVFWLWQQAYFPVVHRATAAVAPMIQHLPTRLFPISFGTRLCLLCWPILLCLITKTQRHLTVSLHRDWYRTVCCGVCCPVLKKPGWCPLPAWVPKTKCILF